VIDALSFGDVLAGTPPALGASATGDRDRPRRLPTVAKNYLAPREGRSGVEIRETGMLGWLLWQLERIEWIHAVAGMLMSDFGVEAGGEARRREREANSAGTARDWSRVASVVARRSPKRAALDAAISPTLLELESVPEPTWIASEPTQAFRIQFCLWDARSWPNEFDGEAH
jgi:hypothetical protein